jgi:RNA dependent RNA polymerase
LAQFTLHAVDYPKTGVPVNFKSLPPPPQSVRPDFLSGEGSNRRLSDRFYRSQNILGILFRDVLIDDYTADRHHRHIQPSDGVKIWNCLLQTNVDFELPSDDETSPRSVFRSAVCYCTSILTIETRGLTSIGRRACQWYDYGTLG